MPRSVKEILEQAEVLADRFATIDPRRHNDARAEGWAALHRATLDRAASDSAIATAVQRVRDNGQSWEAIGQKLGTSGEAARRRYAQKTNRA